MAGETAGGALESILGFSALSVSRATFWADGGSTAWKNLLRRLQPGKRQFISKNNFEVTKLRPFQGFALATFAGTPLARLVNRPFLPVQVFNNNLRTCAFGIANDFIR